MCEYCPRDCDAANDQRDRKHQTSDEELSFPAHTPVADLVDGRPDDEDDCIDGSGKEGRGAGVSDGRDKLKHDNIPGVPLTAPNFALLERKPAELEKLSNSFMNSRNQVPRSHLASSNAL